jgi:hypothetical protein
VHCPPCSQAHTPAQDKKDEQDVSELQNHHSHYYEHCEKPAPAPPGGHVNQVWQHHNKAADAQADLNDPISRSFIEYISALGRIRESQQFGNEPGAKSIHVCIL